MIGWLKKRWAEREPSWYWNASAHMTSMDPRLSGRPLTEWEESVIRSAKGCQMIVWSAEGPRFQFDPEDARKVADAIRARATDQQGMASARTATARED